MKHRTAAPTREKRRAILLNAAELKRLPADGKERRQCKYRHRTVLGLFHARIVPISVWVGVFFVRIGSAFFHGAKK